MAEPIQAPAALCKVHGWRDAPAVARVSWTAYGGAPRSQLACDDCVARVKGQRGVRVTPLGADHG